MKFLKTGYPECFLGLFHPIAYKHNRKKVGLLYSQHEATSDEGIPERLAEERKKWIQVL